MASHTPPARSRANQGYTVRHGGKLSGNNRQAQPARSTQPRPAARRSMASGMPIPASVASVV
jgi:hypothetical protein